MKRSRRHLLSSFLKMPLWLYSLPLGSLYPKSLQGMQATLLFDKNAPKRFLHVFLSGGVDSALTIDPVRGDKKPNGKAYDKGYADVSYKKIAGKSNLYIGEGLYAAEDAFKSTPTAFINGLFVEVTAHELATNYLFSGRLSLSRSREYPALSAILGLASGSFPPHVVLGSEVPLGDTKTQAPPLQARSIDSLTSMLSGPRSSHSKDDPKMPDADIAITQQLIQRLNQLHFGNIPTDANIALSGWLNAEARINDIYSRRFDKDIVLPKNAAIRKSYGIAAEGDDWTLNALLAGAYLTLKSGISPYVSVHFGDFDTHRNHLAEHLPRLKSFAKSFNQLIKDLQTTKDPDQPEKYLIETTTIMVSSEFVRTPIFNAENGTDHWQSGSVILMGQGVSDNTVIGQTNASGEAMGLIDGEAVPKTAENAFLPEHLCCSLLRYFGVADAESTFKVAAIKHLFEGID